MRLIGRKAWLAFSALALAGAACGGSGSADALKSGGKCVPQKTPVITLAAYSTVYDVYGKLTTAFQDQWKTDHDGQSVIFQSSFGGSTTQAQNVANGFPADVVALSLAPDVEIVQKAGLITHDWTKDPDGSIVATTPVVFDVRPGNPKHIADWSDLTRSGVDILTPDPSQSGGAKWNIVAAYGASIRGKVTGYAANSPSDAQKLHLAGSTGYGGLLPHDVPLGQLDAAMRRAVEEETPTTQSFGASEDRPDWAAFTATHESVATPPVVDRGASQSTPAEPQTPNANARAANLARPATTANKSVLPEEPVNFETKPFNLQQAWPD